MARITTNDKHYADIADAIRENAVSDYLKNSVFKPAEMPNGIKVLATENRDEGERVGYDSGHTEGYNEGHSVGYAEGYEAAQGEDPDGGYNAGYEDGRQIGYAEGHTAGITDLTNEIAPILEKLNRGGIV